VTNSEILNILWKIEDTLPVNELKLGKIPIWPLARFSYSCLIRHYYKKKIICNKNISVDSLKSNKEIETRIATSESQEEPLLKNILSNHSGSNLFFSFDFENTELIDGKRYNPYIDPLFEVCQQVHGNCVKLELAHKQNTRLEFVHPPQYYSLTSLKLKKRYGALALSNMVVPNNWNETIIAICFHKDSEIQSALSRDDQISFDAHRHFYKFILRKLKPTSVFFECFWSIPLFALTAACSELHIPTIDIQHGRNHPHPAYSQYKKIPKEGYSIIPRYFWTRDPHSYSNLAHWKDSAHKSFLGKNPWLEKRKNNLTANQKKFLEKINKTKKIILFALHDGSLVPHFWADLIKSFPKEYFFLFRVHPMNIKEWISNDWEPGKMELKIADRYREKLEMAHKTCGPVCKSFLDTHNIKNGDIEFASTIPLPILLKSTSIIVTYQSSIYLEALEFGLRTIFLHTDGRDACPELIQNGTCSYAKDENAIIEEINNSRQIIRIQDIKKNTKTQLIELFNDFNKSNNYES
tara:strand:- start:238 stop:1803 length:1566 start_codon:yes stop_codon:yes gene_type:complete